MGLEEDTEQESWQFNVGDEKKGQQQNNMDALHTKGRRSRNQDLSPDNRLTNPSQDLDSGCKTFLLTQAATLAGSVSAESIASNLQLANKVTPVSLALESPSSPPVASVPSPSSHSIDSPSHQTGSNTSSPVCKSSPRKRGVPHIYRDFTDVPDATGYVRKKTGGVTQPFPEKLHEMLDHVAEPSVVGWLPHGRAFIVRKPKEFTGQIMPKFFRQTKLTSFQRQLNLYGFRRLTQGPDAGAYYHELFLRGRPQLCLRMQRQKVKGTGHKQPADAKTEPNFYSMAPSTYASPSSPEDTSSREEDSRLSTTRYDDMSPGMAGLHGAAHLLKNIAAGVRASPSHDASFSLGESAISSVPGRYDDSHVASLPDELPTFTSFVTNAKPSAIYPAAATATTTTTTTSTTTSDRSMSLLGRVNMDQSSPTPSSDLSTPSQSAFFWPPIRRPVDPPRPRDTPALSTHGLLSIPQQQESAQPSSSTLVKKERANFQASERSATKALLEKGNQGFVHSISSSNNNNKKDNNNNIDNQSKTPFPSSREAEELGRMETKVSNGIETEEV